MTTTSCTLFSLQRFSLDDGPGIRTTLFFKGCPLKCPWCHNPEGMRPEPELAYKQSSCLGCGDCVAACPVGALELDPEGRISIDRDLCDSCGACVEACPPNSLEVFGREYDLEELIGEILKDRSFFTASGGGVTLSGGEPLMHLSFLQDFLRRCREEKLHLALDTSGTTRQEWFGPVLNWTDLVLFDLKLMDAERHHDCIGGPLELVLANLERVVKKDLPVWVRTPVIPGYTDDPGNISAIARHLKANVPTLQRYDLLAFSNMCAAKYEMLGLKFELSGSELLTAERMEELADTARREGVDNVVWSGPVTNGDDEGQQ